MVDENGGGWFWRHVHHVADFVEANPTKVSKSAWNNGLKIKKGFDAAWRNKIQQFQTPIFSPSTKGQWIIRFDDAVADALELGPLRSGNIEIPQEVEARLKAVAPKEVPLEIFRTLIAYYEANKPEDSD